jgi:serine/threonine-protein kinase
MADDIIERLIAALDGRYAVDRQIGQGGMATVYLATDLKHGRQVAIKALRPELSASLGTERFLREIELAAKLQHPHIVPVYDSGSADGVLYYVMPFVEGESLRDLMRREGRIDLTRAAVIVKEAASGLAYAHTHGIVHRDIKPENIMLSAGHAVVADFGIARAVDASRGEQHLTGAGMAIGTPAYMSPEQATADTVDARSDQYALACVFYELVTGKQAFSGPTMQAMLTSMLTGPRPRLSSAVDGVPPAVDGATQRALATNPADRYPTITDFAEAVAEESSGQAAAARESRRWKRLAILLPAVVGLTAVGWMTFFAGPQRTVVSGAESIAIVPFATTGPGLEGIGEGMVDLLVGSLGGVGDIDPIDPRSVIREWRRRVSEGPGDLDDAVAVARATHAASVLMGSIVTTGGKARLSAQLYDLSGTELSRASVDGPADSVLSLSNALALALLRDIWRSREPLPSANASGIRSSSVPAIRDYLRGERYHRRGQWDSAQAAFEEAVAQDSTFALAWYRLANTLGWKGAYQGAQARNASARAVEYSDSLPARLRSLLYASDLFNRADNAAIDSAAAYTRAHPDDADGWYLLGEAQYHARSFQPRSPQELRAPFDRVIELDSSLTQAAIHPLELAITARDTGLIRRYETVFRAADATVELERVRLAREALAGSDSAIAAMFGDAIGSGVAMAALGARLADPRLTGDDIAMTGRALTGALESSPMAAQLRALVPALDAGLGRVDSARAYLRSQGVSSPDMAGYLRMIPMLGGFETAEHLARIDSALAASSERNQYLSTWRGLVALGRGHYSDARASVAAMLTNTDTLQRPIQGALTVIDGIARVAEGDTLGGLQVADRGIDLIGSSVSFNAFTAPVQLRYALMQLGIPSRREAGFARLRWGFPNSMESYPIRERYIAEAFEGRGQADSALVHYQHFLDLWNRADSAYQPTVASARAAVERLSGEVGEGAALQRRTP